MKRYLFVAAAIALLAAACSGGGSVAATVNGVKIDVESVEGLVDPADDLISDEQFLDALTAVVQFSAVADAARDEFEIEPTDEEVLEYSDRIVDAQAAGMTREQFLESRQVTEGGFLLYSSQVLVSENVLERLQDRVVAPTAEEAQQLFLDDPLSWTLVCSAHILVATDEEATAVQARLDAGEDFAAVATEVSLDPGSGAQGGDLGCSSPAQYVPEFADATVNGEIGVVLEPVQTQFGFHLIRVDSRTEATTEQLTEALSDLRLSEVVDAWYRAAISAADVSVAEEFGTWETEPDPAIVPPAS